MSLTEIMLIRKCVDALDMIIGFFTKEESIALWQRKTIRHIDDMSQYISITWKVEELARNKIESQMGWQFDVIIYFLELKIWLIGCMETKYTHDRLDCFLSNESFNRDCYVDYSWTKISFVYVVCWLQFADSDPSVSRPSQVPCSLFEYSKICLNGLVSFLLIFILTQFCLASTGDGGGVFIVLLEFCHSLLVLA